MKLVHLCFNLSLPILKLILFLVLLLIAFNTQLEDNKSINSNFSKKAIITYQIDLNSNIKLNNQTLNIKTFYAHDSTHFSANQTNSVTFLNKNNSKLVSTNFIDLHGLLNYKNMKNSIKMTIFIFLNAACSIINLLCISYLIIHKQEQLSKHFGKTFLSFHFYLNFFIFSLILVSSSFFVLYISNTKLINSNNYLAEWIQKLIHENSLNSNLKFFIDLNSYNMLTNLNCDLNYISKMYLKFNIILMIATTCFLASYGYLLYISNETNENREDDHTSNKNDDSESEDEELILKDFKTLSEVNQFREKKFIKNVNINLQWIINSILIIIALSIWDFSDIYHHLNAKKYFSGPNLDLKDFSLFKKLKENNLISTNNKNVNFGDFKFIDNGLKSINYSNDLYINDETNYYKTYVLKRNTQILKYIKDNANDIMQQYQATTKVKILFYFKNNNRLFSNILVVLLLFIIISKLKNIQDSLDYFNNSVDFLFNI